MTKIENAMRLSEAQMRAVEMLAGKEGWVRRGTIQKKTMDVLVREGLVEEKRDTALHVTMYRLAPKTSADSARVTADAAQDALDTEQTATGIHAACGRKLADHCAYCDTCVCGCPVADTIAATDGAVHGECGKPLADHCADCDECPRTDGPCWCRSTVTDEPVTIVPGSTAPGFKIDFGPLAMPVYRVRGHADRDHHLIASDPLTVTLRPVHGGMEWTYDRAEVYRVDGVPLLTVADVVTMMTPAEAVSLLHARERGWARRNKTARSRRRRYARKGR